MSNPHPTPTPFVPFCVAFVFQEMLRLRQDISMRSKARWRGYGKRKEKWLDKEKAPAYSLFFP